MMKNAVHTYWAIVTGGAIALFLLLDWSVLGSLTPGDWVGLGTFLFVAILSQYLAIDSTLGAAKPVKSSIAFLPLLALAVVMHVPAVVLVTATMTTVHEVFLREKYLARTLFNIGQTALSYGIAAMVFHRLAPDSGGAILSLFFPFYALALTFFTCNVVFVTLTIAIRQRESFSVVLREAVGKGGGNLLYDLLASPLALFVALAYDVFHVGGLLAVMLPLLLVRHSYLSAIRLQQSNRDLLRVLVKAIETRDPYTSGHSLRVQTLAKAIAVDHGLRPSVAETVETAALLHDIGKIDVQFANVIMKPSELSPEERALIQSHAIAGADLLESLTSVERDVIVAVRHHHERYDGTGYPDRLRGDEIPVAARIIMIADAVDAMLSDRPYRDALSVSAVEAELVRCSGTQFDPGLVKTILKHDTLQQADQLVERSGARQVVGSATRDKARSGIP